MSEAAWRPVAPDRLPGTVADWLAATPGTMRVALDGPPCTRPGEFAVALVEPLRAAGRPAVHIAAELFWHDASVRLEHGHEDVEAYRGWLDAGALRREVLDTVVDGGRYLPSLRDPRTNRSTREPARLAGPGTVVLVSGALLLARGLPFDRSVHLAMSSAARTRHTPADQSWTLPAFDEYDAQQAPSDRADMVIRMNDPVHPAVRWSG